MDYAEGTKPTDPRRMAIYFAKYGTADGTEYQHKVPAEWCTGVLAKGAALDKMFLQMMTTHHRGAIQMAESDLAQGQNAQAKNLARKIPDDQRGETSTMEGMLKSM